MLSSFSIKILYTVSNREEVKMDWVFSDQCYRCKCGPGPVLDFIFLPALHFHSLPNRSMSYLLTLQAFDSSNFKRSADSCFLLRLSPIILLLLNCCLGISLHGHFHPHASSISSRDVKGRSSEMF